MLGIVLTSTLVCCMLLHGVASSHVFFHEPSAVLLTPEGDTNPRADFGFSLGYWTGSLIVGSPSSNFIGEVYTCPLDKISGNKLLCSVIDIDLNGTIDYALDSNPDQNFYLGGSIATTKDYVFICAPLVTMKLNDTIDPHIDAVGSCFVYDGHTSTPYNGPAERFLSNEDRNTDLVEGGTGWTTLADEEEDYLFIAKTSVAGDINYVPISNVSQMVSSIITNDLVESKSKNTKNFREYWNVGNAITKGKFFSNEPVYAISLLKKLTTTDTILFLQRRPSKQERNGKTYVVKIFDFVLNKFGKRKHPFSIEENVIGGLFGYSLASADLTLDGYSELIVGAPLQSEDINELEYGAVHIYHDLRNHNKKRTTIIGSTPKGRFGTSITVSDVDGDHIPEVFVSAPYEESGVVYVLSGVEVQRLLNTSAVLQVTKLQLYQRITQASYTRLGFSLQVLPDLDGNGCNEIAIGAPASAKVMLLRCLQTIKAEVSTELKGASVRIQDSMFTVRVCVAITYMCTPNVTGILDVNTEIIGNAIIKKPSFKVDLSIDKDKICEDITVDELQIGEIGEYTVITKLKQQDISSRLEFDKSWAKLSIDSKTESKTDVNRQCSADEDCTPHLSLTVNWQSNPKSDPDARNVYVVESTSSETVSVTLKNIGVVATGSRCIVLSVVGAPVSSASKCRANAGSLECSTVTQLRPNDEDIFNIEVDTSSMLSSVHELVITATMYDSWERKEKIEKQEKMIIEYSFDEAWKGVKTEGVSHVKYVTDTELLASKEEDNNKENIFNDDQEYLITNDGQVTWESVSVTIRVESRPFITLVTTAEYNCATDKDDRLSIKCTITLQPRTTTKMMVSVEMYRKALDDALSSQQDINVTSHIDLFPSTHPDLKNMQTLVTDIKLAHDMSFKNNPVLIAIVAIIVALIVLALVAYCLYKRGFFKRKQKKKLNEFRESVRRRSVRIASERSNRNHSQKSPSSADGEDPIDIEVVEDSPFEEVPINSKDDKVLIESKAEIHAEEVNKRKTK